MNPIEAARTWIKAHGIIEAEIYDPVPDKPGYLRLARMRLFSEVWARIADAIKAHEAELSYEYVSSTDCRELYGKEFPQSYRWCVYLVEGANEGYYCHIAISTGNTLVSIGLVKSLGTWEAALRILNFVTVLVNQRW